MFGASKGFVFSLDSFVAFSLILIAIQSLVVISSTPSGYYHSLAQANFAAQDTMAILSHVRVDDGRHDLFGPAASAGLRGDLLGPTDKLPVATDKLIPDPFSYAYDFYSFEDGEWHLVYNASDAACPAKGGSFRFCNVSFNRVQAASSVFAGFYIDSLEAGDSPYCNVACTGYVPGSGPSEPAECTQVPCNIKPASTFFEGDYRLGLMRLRVWG